MNRRSMIKNTALGASAAVISVGEANAQPQAGRSTPVINGVDNNGAAIPLTVNTNQTVKVAGILEVRSNLQSWDYKVIPVPANTTPEALEATLIKLGKDGYELVGITGNGLALKRPIGG